MVKKESLRFYGWSFTLLLVAYLVVATAFPTRDPTGFAISGYSYGSYGYGKPDCSVSLCGTGLYDTTQCLAPPTNFPS